MLDTRLSRLLDDLATALPAAFRWNTALKALYRRLTERGKPHAVALVACANSSSTPTPSSPAEPRGPKNQPTLNGCYAIARFDLKGESLRKTRTDGAMITAAN